ncbi:MAG: right-handed parallel beta-helix repeat-containing protein [Candidatus Bathyarchaeota archaeon]|nr:right-handed parallel beta-helix repeat-containing protein [Candidatus Bathyarchaeota archaeon]
MKKILPVILGVLLIFSASTLSIIFVSAQSTGYVTINVDGTVEPASASIQRNGNLYTLTGDIAEYLVVKSNYSIVDGGGYHVGGVYGPLLVQSGYSYTADGVTNVAVTNLTIDGQGIVFFSAANSVLSYITINNGTGIDVTGNGNQISNIIINYGRGLSINGKNNLISYNHLTLCNYTFAENNPPPYGVYVGGSNNIVKGNWIVGTNGSGVDLGTSFNNIVYGNQIWENKIGIRTMTIYSQNKAENNIVYYNNFIANQENYHDEMIMTAPHSITIWDFDTFGNYWGDYTGTDANGDGKGDIPYIIDADNQDRYPLIKSVDLNNLPTMAAASPIPTPALTPVGTSNNTTPSPSVPEFSWVAILSLLFILGFVVMTFRYRKKVNLIRYV